MVNTFYSLMNTEHLSAQKRSYVKKLLAQLHGMRRCSVMLCPLLTAAELKQLPGTTASLLLWCVQAFLICTTLYQADGNPPFQDVFLQDVALSKVLTGRVHQANHYIQANHSCNDTMVVLMQVL